MRAATTTFFLAGLCTTVSASKCVARTYNPPVMDIPGTCKVTDVYPGRNSNSVTEYIPSKDIMGNYLLYSLYYPATVTVSDENWSSYREKEGQECLKRCYGYGNHETCKTAFWSGNLLVPKGYNGTDGGNLQVGCLLFTKELSDNNDWSMAPSGQGKGGWAETIDC